MNDRRENHWYVVRSMLGAGRPPRLHVMALAFVLIVTFWFLLLVAEGAAPFVVSGVVLALLPAVSAVAWLGARVRAARAAEVYARALHSSTPDAAVAAIETTMRGTQRLPDGDALLAHAKATAYALYAGATTPPARSPP